MNLQHSAKGSTWKEHKYIKRVNGTYYYPKGYKGGNGAEESSKKDDLEDWEKTMYDDIEAALKKNPGLFDVSQITSDDWQDFGLTLAEFAGVDSDKLSKEEIERMRKKVADHYAEKENKNKLDAEDVEALAKEVIRGNFGNGTVRKELLGEDYSDVQKRVNEILKKGSKPSNSSKVKHSELCHHGIKGQRWGVRRFQPYPDGTTRKAVTVERKKAKGEKREDLKNRSILSDDQLRKKINRLQMEKQLRELTASEINSGKSYVQSILKDVGKRTLTTAFSGAALYAGKAFVTKSFDVKEFGGAIFNGGPKKK